MTPAIWIPRTIAAAPGNGYCAPVEAYTLAPRLGRGWVDLHEAASGLRITRMCCQFRQPLEYEHLTLTDSTRISLYLEGYSILMPTGASLGIAAGDVLLRPANAGWFRNRTHGGGTRPLTCIALDVPAALMTALRADGVLTADLAPIGACAVLRTNPNTAAELRRLGWRIMALRSARDSSAPGLESLGLDLLRAIVTTTGDWRSPATQPLPHHARLALNRALDIMHGAWDQPLSIGTLAHRTGLNACYLKLFFRQHFGHGIAAHLRRLRMQRAFDQLASGRHSVQQVALSCGYLHAGKFAQAFRRAYGVAPSMI